MANSETYIDELVVLPPPDRRRYEAARRHVETTRKKQFEASLKEAGRAKRSGQLLTVANVLPVALGLGAFAWLAYYRPVRLSGVMFLHVPNTDGPGKAYKPYSAKGAALAAETFQTGAVMTVRGDRYRWTGSVFVPVA